MTITVRASLFNAQQAMTRFQAIYRDLKPYLLSGHRFEVVIRPEKRSDAANARMWVLLDALSKQVVWHGQRLTSDEWKDVMTAALARQKVVPGIDGGFVVLGQRTSQMTRAEMAELQDCIEAFGAQQGVDFSEVLVAEPA
jgi:hypothetical protein